MEYQNIKGTGLKVSRFGLGTMMFGGQTEKDEKSSRPVRRESTGTDNGMRVRSVPRPRKGTRFERRHRHAPSSRLPPGHLACAVSGRDGISVPVGPEDGPPARRRTNRTGFAFQIHFLAFASDVEPEITTSNRQNEAPCERCAVARAFGVFCFGE